MCPHTLRKPAWQSCTLRHEGGAHPWWRRQDSRAAVAAAQMTDLCSCCTSAPRAIRSQARTREAGQQDMALSSRIDRRGEGEAPRARWMWTVAMMVCRCAGGATARRVVCEIRAHTRRPQSDYDSARCHAAGVACSGPAIRASSRASNSLLGKRKCSPVGGAQSDAGRQCTNVRAHR